MSTIGASDAKTRLSELLHRAERGESFVITKHGRPVARLIPGGTQDAARVAAAAARLRSFRGTLSDLTVSQLQADKRDGHKY